MANNIKEAGNAMRRELGKLCEIQLADGMLASARKSDAACTAWDNALSELSKGERTFTESEVLAILGEAELLARTMGALLLDEAEAKLMAASDIETIKVRHGVSLDPA